jgi:hypothetical protein
MSLIFVTFGMKTTLSSAGPKSHAGDRQRREEGVAVVVGLAVEHHQREPEARLLRGVPARRAAGEDRGVAPRIPIEAGVEEKVEALARNAIARAEARVEPVVDAGLARLVGVEVPGEAVEVDAHVGAAGARARAARRRAARGSSRQVYLLEPRTIR